MGSVNQGGQRIGWKYSTPLQADYLNTFIAGMTTPGLVTRPSFVFSPGAGSTMLTIGKFSMFVNPTEDKNEGEPRRLIKVSTTSSVQLTIDSTIIAIGFEFSFTPNSGIAQSQWFGDFKALTKSDVSNPNGEYAEGKNGLIIATLMHRQVGNTFYHWVSTSGADISDCLLREEGWDPCRWVSLISPRRIGGVGGYLNKLEVRKHNKAFDGCVNGITGCVNFKNNQALTQWEVPSDGPGSSDPNGEWGVLIPNKYTLFEFNATGLSASKGAEAFPIENTPGNILAYGDKSAMSGDGTNFMNHYEIHPVDQEKINVWFEGATETLRIS